MSAAERKARLREREARGLVVLGVEVDQVALGDALLAAGLLAGPHELDDRDKLSHALSRLVALILAGKLERVPLTD
jgi:hypothetical protein